MRSRLIDHNLQITKKKLPLIPTYLPMIKLQSNKPNTFVVVTLDPPIRKGQKMYPHIVLQFETDYVVESTLIMNADLFATKYKDKLESSILLVLNLYPTCPAGHAAASWDSFMKYLQWY